MTTKPPSPPPAKPPAPPDDPDAPASEEEIAASDALRRALDDPGLPNEAADLARAASLAHAPRPIDPAVHRRIVEAALARGPARGGRLIRFSFGAAAALALAAGAVFVVGSMGGESPEAAPSAAVARAPVFRVRSTQPLFEEPFSTASPACARGASEPSSPACGSSGSSHVDRIAMARASDFRENEFSRWGAR